ncbi:hypothetical protein [Pseudoduganella aquatica]|uniref:hypothetical protein n=1 Tax=Pseudoduganella aquatica TaxID=2660641 RepID=UPI001E347E62|nr:hypothetical protein [Pseudoduganella aquatica]
MTSRKASNGAAFNKMPIWQAVFKLNKINDLQRHLNPTRAAFLPVEKIFSACPYRSLEPAWPRPIESFDKNAGEE